MTPYEVRLELLKMAQGMLEQEYYGKREVISNTWNARMDYARSTNSKLPDHPNYPEYPTEEDIIRKATLLNKFISTH